MWFEIRNYLNSWGDEWLIKKNDGLFHQVGKHNFFFFLSLLNKWSKILAMFSWAWWTIRKLNWTSSKTSLAINKHRKTNKCWYLLTLTQLFVWNNFFSIDFAPMQTHNDNSLYMSCSKNSFYNSCSNNT